MLGGGCQVGVVIENMIGRMENLRTLISGFLGLVILVRWSLVTMFLSWTTQTGCRIHRTYVSLIGSGEGRHTTHLLKCVLLLSPSQTDWKQSSDVLSDISFDILSDISSNILSDISFDMLSDISSDILSDISKPKPNIHSFTKKSSSANSIFTSHHAAKVISMTTLRLSKVIALSASDRPAKRQLSPKMQNACSSTRTHSTCIRPPRQKAVESKNAKGFKVPQLHLMACANHEARRLPLWFFHFFCVGGSAPHIICLPLVHSILPKRGRSAKDCSTLLQLLLALRIWNRPPFIRHIPHVSLHNFWQDKHTIPSMCSARRLHAHVDALSTNKSQLVAPHMLNSFGKPIGSPNEDRLRTFHHNLRHGCQTKLTSLHKKKLSQQYLLQCATSNKKQNAIHKIPLVQTWILVLWDISFDILSDISFGILSDMSPHILSDISSDILSDISFAILSDISSGILYDISFWHISWHSSWHIFWHSFWHIFWHSFWLIFWHSSWHIFWHSFWHIFWHSFWHIFWHSFWHLSDISFDILSDISSDISFWRFFWHIFWHSFWHIFCHSFWHIFWHSFWHIFRHSFWHIFWHSFWHIFLTYLLTIFLTSFWHIFWHSFWHIFWHSFWHVFWHTSWHFFWHSFWHIFCHSFWHIFWHSFWHIFWHSFWHIFWHSFWHLSDISFDILSDISSDISFWHFFWHIFWHSFWHIFCHSFWQIFWHKTWGPARHTELAGSRLRSGTPQRTRRIAVEVRHATLNSRARGWGPARHTELTGSRLGSGTPHWTHELAVGVRHATLNSRARGWGPARHTELTRSWLRSGTSHGRNR